MARRGALIPGSLRMAFPDGEFGHPADVQNGWLALAAQTGN